LKIVADLQAYMVLGSWPANGITQVIHTIAAFLGTVSVTSIVSQRGEKTPLIVTLSNFWPQKTWEIQRFCTISLASLLLYKVAQTNYK
jgi:hypothetical protein